MNLIRPILKDKEWGMIPGECGPSSVKLWVKCNDKKFSWSFLEYRDLDDINKQIELIFAYGKFLGREGIDGHEY